MVEFFIEVTKEHQIKGEGLLLKAFKRLKSGRYRCQLFSTNKRSLNQNSYVHVVFTLAQKGLYDLGYENITSMETAKRFYKEMFLTIQAVNKKTGELYPYVRGTSELSKDEMAFFIQQVIDHQLEWAGVYIPSSDEYLKNYSKYDLVTLAE